MEYECTLTYPNLLTQDDQARDALTRHIALPFEPAPSQTRSDVCLSQPGLDRRGRFFPDALKPTPAPSPGIQPSTLRASGRGAATTVVGSTSRKDASLLRRILLPVWSDALASGRKWVEAQRYTGPKSGNHLKFATKGKVVLFGPSGVDFGQIHGAAVLAGPALVGLDAAALRAHCQDRMASNLRVPFEEYVLSGKVFGVVDVSHVRHAGTRLDLGDLGGSAGRRHAQANPRLSNRRWLGCCPGCTSPGLRRTGARLDCVRTVGIIPLDCSRLAQHLQNEIIARAALSSSLLLCSPTNDIIRANLVHCILVSPQ